MQIENKFHIYLDYAGYMIEPKAARILPSPLFGNKFSTGSANYNDLDFWQSSAMTNFTKGINQKFFSDTSAYWFSTGIDVSNPGEFSLERDLVADVALSEDEDHGVVSASYKSVDKLWVGTTTGYVFYRGISATTWTLEEDITSDGKPVTGFFEIVDQYSEYDKALYVCKGDYKGWIKLNDEWLQIAPIVQWAPSTSNVTGVKLGDSGSLTRRKIAQSSILTSHREVKRFSLLYKTIGGWTGNVTVKIHLSDPITGKIAANSEIKSFTIALPNQPDWGWLDYDISSQSDYFVLSRCDKYFLEILPSTSANNTACPEFACTIGNDSYYDGDTLIEVIDGETEYDFAAKGEQMAFKFWGDLPTGVDKVSSQGFSAFGWVDNGIKTTSNGCLWSPDGSKGLWTLPASEGKAKALGRTSRGTVVGGASSLWLFVGGTSALNIWDFPDYANDNNFKGFHQWNNRVIFSVENQGLFMTDGSTVGQTNINSEREAFKFKGCAGITTSGWDAFALCKNSSDEWYLLRSNSYYDGSFIYWWGVKKLSKEPIHITSLNINTVLIFYSDGTIEKYSKDGLYQASGYIETSLFDAGLIKLDKLFKNIEAIFEPFEAGTSCTIGYRTSMSDNYTTSSSFITAPHGSVLYSLFNPTSGNRIQIKVTLNSNTAKNKSSVCTDLVWSYVLQRGFNEKNIMKTFYVTILCQDNLEDNTGDVEFYSIEGARKRQDIVNSLWDLAEKREVVNYIGIDNVSQPAFLLEYNGEEEYLITTDRTNYLLTITSEGEVVHSYYYKGKTSADIVADLDGLIIGEDAEEIKCSLVDPFGGTESVDMLEPVKDVIITKESYLNIGTDVRAVIVNPQSPSQVKLELDGAGADRIQLNLREAD